MIVREVGIPSGTRAHGDVREPVQTYVELGAALAISTVQGCGGLKEGSPLANRSGMFYGRAGREAPARRAWITYQSPRRA